MLFYLLFGACPHVFRHRSPITQPLQRKSFVEKKFSGGHEDESVRLSAHDQIDLTHPRPSLDRKSDTNVIPVLRFKLCNVGHA
jgi:hypothetical protein